MRLWKISWMALIAIVLDATAISAQTGAQEFVPATDLARESLPAGPLIYTAYAFVWVMLTVYVFLLWRRLGRVEREIADVAAKLSSRR